MDDTLNPPAQPDAGEGPPAEGSSPRREEIRRRVWGTATQGSASRARPLRRPARAEADEPDPNDPGSGAGAGDGLAAAVESIRSMLRSADLPSISSRLEALEHRVAAVALSEGRDPSALEDSLARVDRLSRALESTASRTATSSEGVPEGLISAIAQLAAAADVLAEKVDAQPHPARLMSALDESRDLLGKMVEAMTVLRDEVGRTRQAAADGLQNVAAHLERADFGTLASDLRHSLEQGPRAVAGALADLDRRSGSAFGVVAREVRDLVDEFRVLSHQIDAMAERIATVEVALRPRR